MAKNVIYLISFLICSIVTQAQTAAWDGTTVATKLVNAGKGTGTKESPIEIASASELAYLAQKTNAGGTELTLDNGGPVSGKTNFQDVYFKLTEDIDLGEQAWTPIGKNSSYPFKGVFDGNGKKIRNMAAISTDDYYYAGLFGRIENSTVQNLQIEIASTGLHVTGLENIGTLAGYITDSKITKCSVTGGCITGESAIFSQLIVGGLIGQVISSEVTDCSSTVDVTATLSNAMTLSAGGICGVNASSSITNSQYSGSVMAIDANNTNSYAGGISGASDLQPVGGSSNTSTISECSANVNISAGAYAGGIIGFFTEGTVEKCTVEGVISTKETGGHAGGIMGKNRYGGTVTDCHNTASVTSLDVAGGIVGYEYTTSLFTISKCWSSGDITAPTAGGIAGWVGFGTIEECYASGNITGKASTESYAGGIAGYAASETIKNCTSTADITAEREGEKQAFAGGIVGVGLKSSYSPKSTSIQNCYATGKISSNFAAGGIAGLNQGTEGSITNCIALNKEGIGEITENKSLLKSTTGVYGRITAKKQGTLASNFACPLIPGNWDSDADEKDGDDLTSDNFTKDAGNAFDQWDDANVWSFDPSGENLPVLKVFGENTGGGQPEKPVQPNIPKSDFLAFTLTYDAPQNGSITVSSSTQNSIPAGSSISGGMVLTITATPNTGYDLASLKVNDTDFISGETYIVNSDVKVEATFSKIPPEPDPNPEPGPGPDYPITYYSVMLPQVEGITTDPEAGEYEVESWSSFRFYLTLAPEYDQSNPIVTTDRGETITPRASDGAYIVKYVRSNVEIFIDGVVKNPDPVANGTVEADGIHIRASKGLLDIHVPQPETVSVYSFSGFLLYSRELVAGDTRLPMPSGTYIVKVGDKVAKVMF